MKVTITLTDDQRVVVAARSDLAVQLPGYVRWCGHQVHLGRSSSFVPPAITVEPVAARQSDAGMSMVSRVAFDCPRAWMRGVVRIDRVPPPLTVRNRPIVVGRREIARFADQHAMRSEDRVAVALGPLRAIDGRELHVTAEAVTQCLRLIAEVGILEHLLETQHVGPNLPHLSDDDVQALRPVVLVVPQIERDDRERVGRFSRRRRER